MKIAFWSPLHGTGTTACMMAIAAVLSGKMKKYCLLTQTHFELNDLEEALIGRNIEQSGDDYIRDMGVDALVRYFKAGILTEEMVCGCSTIIGDNLAFLPGSRQTVRENFESRIFTGMFLKIIKASESFYDMVLVDVNSGYSPQSLEMIENSDLVVVVLNQGRRMTQRFLKCGFPVHDKERFYCFSRYCRESRYSIHNLKKLNRSFYNGNMGAVPFEPAYLDAIDERRVVEYFRQMADSSNGRESYFYTEIISCAEKIADLAERRDR